jgi:hypothetical protein
MGRKCLPSTCHQPADTWNRGGGRQTRYWRHHRGHSTTLTICYVWRLEYTGRQPSPKTRWNRHPPKKYWYNRGHKSTVGYWNVRIERLVHPKWHPTGSSSHIHVLERRKTIVYWPYTSYRPHTACGIWHRHVAKRLWPCTADYENVNTGF